MNLDPELQGRLLVRVLALGYPSSLWPCSKQPGDPSHQMPSPRRDRCLDRRLHMMDRQEVRLDDFFTCISPCLIEPDVWVGVGWFYVAWFTESMSFE